MTDPTRRPRSSLRVQQLLSLATDPAASQEEARTAALEAAKRIQRDGMHVMTAEEAWEAQQAQRAQEWAANRPRGGYRSPQEAAQAAYDRHYDEAAYGNVTPRSHQMGPGTPRLPRRQPAPSRAIVRQDETGYGVEPMRGGAHVVNLDFKDDTPGETREPAFSPALLALLGRR